LEHKMVSNLTSLSRVSQVTKMRALDMWYSWSRVLQLPPRLTQTGSLGPT